jgi:hypothetical protein
MRQRHQSKGASGYWQDYSSYANDPSTNGDDKASAFFVFGTRYVMSARRSFVLEALDQQDGLLKDQMQTYFDFAASNTALRPDDQIIGRHYALASYQDDESVHGWHLEADLLDSLSDGSNFGVLVARYNVSPITSVELAPTFYSGDRGTEFGERPYSRLYYVSFKGRF